MKQALVEDIHSGRVMFQAVLLEHTKNPLYYVADRDTYEEDDDEDAPSIVLCPRCASEFGQFSCCITLPDHIRVLPGWGLMTFEMPNRVTEAEFRDNLGLVCCKCSDTVGWPVEAPAPGTPLYNPSPMPKGPIKVKRLGKHEAE